MAIVLDRRGNVVVGQNPKNFRARKARMKVSPEAKKQLEAIRQSIKDSKEPIKVVRLKSSKNLPKNALPETRKFLKKEPKNLNPDTKRKRHWTYKKYPAILPPMPVMKKLLRSPHAILLGSIYEQDTGQDWA